MRKASVVVAIFATLLLSAFALSSRASADPNGPGSSGTLKIHDADASVEDMRNEPQVCRFYVDGSKFDNNASGQWWIQSWPPTGNGTEVKRESWKADAKGDWHSGIETLPNGHYQLSAKQQHQATPGGTKQTVFWVECGSKASGGSTGTSTGPNGIVIFRPGTLSPNAGAVRGFERAPSENATGAVSPIVELPGGSNQQSPNGAVSGVETSPVAAVQSLPSTSTDGTPSVPLAALGLVIIGLGGALLRRGARA